MKFLKKLILLVVFACQSYAGADDASQRQETNLSQQDICVDSLAAHPKLQALTLATALLASTSSLAQSQITFDPVPGTEIIVNGQVQPCDGSITVTENGVICSNVRL